MPRDLRSEREYAIYTPATLGTLTPEEIDALYANDARSGEMEKLRVSEASWVWSTICIALIGFVALVMAANGVFT
jgi:hypothetical protein